MNDSLEQTSQESPALPCSRADWRWWESAGRGLQSRRGTSGRKDLRESSRTRARAISRYFVPQHRRMNGADGRKGHGPEPALALSSELIERNHGRQDGPASSPGSGDDVPWTVRQQAANHHQCPKDRHPHGSQGSKEEKGWPHRAFTCPCRAAAKERPRLRISARQAGPESTCHRKQAQPAWRCCYSASKAVSAWCLGGEKWRTGHCLAR